MAKKKAQVAVENINCPGQTTNVDAIKYAATKEVLLKVLSKNLPGLTQKQMFEGDQAALDRSF